MTKHSAFFVARNAHKGVNRVDGKPYISHPVAVAKLVKKYKGKSHQMDALIKAALLHDTVEDTDLRLKDIETMFGTLVASLVDELTTDDTKKNVMGKTDYLSDKMSKMSSWGLVIKLADRLHNVSSLSTGKSIEWARKYSKQTRDIIAKLREDREIISQTHKRLINAIIAKLDEFDSAYAESVEIKRFSEFVQENTIYECSEGFRYESLEENSKLFERNYERFVTSRTIQPWARKYDFDVSNKNVLRKQIEDLHDEIEREMVVPLKAKLLSKLKTSVKGVQNPKYMIATKPLTSIIDKVINRSQSIEYLNDWLRCAILVPSEEDVETVTKNIFKAFDEIQYYEDKTKPREWDKFGYYGSRHFLAVVDGMSVEIQLMTKKLWREKKAAHKIYTKFRSADTEKMDKKELDRIMATSRKIFDRGNGKNVGRFEIDALQ